MKISSIKMVNMNSPAFMKKTQQHYVKPPSPPTPEKVVEYLMKSLGISEEKAREAVARFPSDGDQLYDTPPTRHKPTKPYTPQQGDKYVQHRDGLMVVA